MNNDEKSKDKEINITKKNNFFILLFVVSNDCIVDIIIYEN